MIGEMLLDRKIGTLSGLVGEALEKLCEACEEMDGRIKALEARVEELEGRRGC